MKEKGIESARRTQQYSGTEGTSDVVASGVLENWHIESKATKVSKLTKSMLNKWYDQIIRDCPAGKSPVIFNKANKKEMLAILPFNVWNIMPKPEISYNALMCINDSVEAANILAEMHEIKLISSWLVKLPVTTVGVIYYLLGYEGEAPNLFVMMRADDFMYALTEGQKRIISD